MPTKEQRPVANFNRIILSGYGDIILTQGENESLVIESEPEVLENLLSEVRGDGALELKFKVKNWFNWLFSSHPPIKYYITARQVNGVSISGSGSLQCNGLKTGELSLSTSGSSQIDLEPLEATSLDLRVSGSSKAGIAGTVDTLEVHISGSGKLLAPELKTRITEIHISGSGEVVTNPSEELDVRISGSGTVRYFGQPKVSKRISGSGSIEPAK